MMFKQHLVPKVTPLEWDTVYFIRIWQWVVYFIININIFLSCHHMLSSYRVLKTNYNKIKAESTYMVLFTKAEVWYHSLCGNWFIFNSQASLHVIYLTSPETDLKMYRQSSLFLRYLNIHLRKGYGWLIMWH